VIVTLFDVIPFWDAIMFADPVPCATANPAAVTVTILVFEEDQATEVVMFCVLPSVNVPIAVNWSVVPFAIEALAALMVIDCSVAAVIVRTIELEAIPFCVAVIVLVPAVAPVTRPAPLIVATDVFDEFHVTEFVRFCVLPSLKVPLALN